MMSRGANNHLEQQVKSLLRYMIIIDQKLNLRWTHFQAENPVTSELCHESLTSLFVKQLVIKLTKLLELDYFHNQNQ